MEDYNKDEHKKYYSWCFSLNDHQHILTCTYFQYGSYFFKKMHILEVELLFPAFHTDSLFTVSGF